MITDMPTIIEAGHKAALRIHRARLLGSYHALGTVRFDPDLCHLYTTWADSLQHDDRQFLTRYVRARRPGELLLDEVRAGVTVEEAAANLTAAFQVFSRQISDAFGPVLQGFNDRMTNFFEDAERQFEEDARLDFSIVLLKTRLPVSWVRWLALHWPKALLPAYIAIWHEEQQVALGSFLLCWARNLTAFGKRLEGLDDDD